MIYNLDYAGCFLPVNAYLKVEDSSLETGSISIKVTIKGTVLCQDNVPQVAQVDFDKTASKVHVERQPS